MATLFDTEEEKKENSTPDPMMALLFFFIVTTIYCIISMFLNDTTQRLICKVCYMLFVVIGEFFINLTLSESLCGVSQWRNTFFVTIIPWFLIFGVLHLFLIMFPGWMSPFSNTFGYLVAKLMGLPDLMKEMLVVPEDLKDKPTARVLASVISDNSLLINQLFTEKQTQLLQAAKNGIGIWLDENGKDQTIPDGADINDPTYKKYKPKPVAEEDKGDSTKYINAVSRVDGNPIWERKNFDSAWNQLLAGNIIKDPNTIDRKIKENKDYDNERSLKNKGKLYGFVQMKYTISEYIWNLLTGFLVTSVSYNYIINTGCAKSPQEMKKRYDAYEAGEEGKKREAEEKKKKEDDNTNKAGKGVQNLLT